MIEFGFGALALRRLEAMVTPGNERSCRLLGAARLSLAKACCADYGFWKGRYWDQIVFGLTRAGAAPHPVRRTRRPGGRPRLARQARGGKSGLHGDKAAGNARRG